MMSDRYEPLTKRTRTLGSDHGTFTVAETTDAPITGKILTLSGTQRVTNQKLGIDATAELYTDAELAVDDQVIDADGIIYTVTYIFTDFITRYQLKPL